MPACRIFLSAATNEFGEMRGRLATLLQRSGFAVEHQDIFPQTAADTVRKLGNLISECSLVVHIVGHQAGSVANPAAVLDLLHEIPETDLLHRLPDLKSALGDLSGITYTQWEAFLALHYGIDVLVYAPSDACEPGTTTVSASFGPKQHLERLRIPRRYPDWCKDQADFIGKIMADVFRHFGLPLESIPVDVPVYLPQRNSHFRGRMEDLSKLHTALDQSGTVGITQQVALLASGGVGKSSLALEFAWDCFAVEPVKFPGGVFWLDCRGREPESLATGLAAFAPVLGIGTSANEDVFPVASRVRDRLSSGPPSLLILDNILDAVQWKDKAWAELLPVGRCRRLLTTRSEDLGDRRIPLLRLDCLSKADARALLHAYREDVTLDPCGDVVDAIIEWFGGLAIGLTTVGIYMGIHSALRWDHYWQSLRDRKLDTVRGTEDLAEPADYGQRVEAVIDDLFHAQSPAEQRALYYATILPGDDVSDRWLIKLLSEDVSAGKITGMAPPGYASLPDAILQTLLRGGILSRVIDTPLRRTVAMHQIVSERLRELLAVDPEVSQEVIKHTDRFARQNYHRSCQWTQAIAEAANFEDAEKLIHAMTTVGIDPNAFHFNCLINKAGNYTEARAVLEEMVKAGETPDVVTFSTLLTKAGNYTEARAVLEEMVKAGETPDVVTFNSLLTKAGNYTEARAVLEEMVKAEETPNVVTFNSLLKKARENAEVHEVAAMMRDAGVRPDVVAFTILISKTRTYAEALAVFQTMRDARVKPNEVTFSTMFTKWRGMPTAAEVLKWFFAQPVHPLKSLNKLASTLEGGHRFSEAEIVRAEIAQRLASQ